MAVSCTYCAPQLVAVAVKTDGPLFEVGKSTPLFTMSAPFLLPLLNGGPAFQYHVTADGQRFLITTPLDAPNRDRDPITVVLNWPAALKRPQQGVER